MTQKAKPSVCLITNELYPVGPGGIGRMLYNYAKDNQKRGLPADIHFLIPQELAEKPNAMDLLDETFSDLAQMHVVPKLEDVPVEIAQLLSRSTAWTMEWQFAASYKYYLGLLAAEKKHGAPFDFIEFPDFGGWGVATLEAKRAGLAFASSKITTRLHSTQGVLYERERYAHTPGNFSGVLFDSERELLANADLVIGHVKSIVDHNKNLYGFADAWLDRTVIEFPPIVLDDSMTKGDNEAIVVGSADPSNATSANADFVFSSRLQPIKRPDLFIRAAIVFLEKHKKSTSSFRLVTNGWDPAYIDNLVRLVPKAFDDRITFHFNATEAERSKFIRNSIVVIPSDFESLNIFAFEASEMGCKVILNAVCPAFGQSDRWLDGENCLLFDGSVSGLMRAMEKSIAWDPQSRPSVVASQPYWLSPSYEEPVTQIEKPKPFSLTVVCFGFESKADFERYFNIAAHLENVLHSDESEQIVFALPKGLFSSGGEEARRVKDRGWRVLFTSGIRECPAEFGKKIYNMCNEYVLFCPIGYELNPNFIHVARDRLSRQSDISVFAGHVQLIDSATANSVFLRVYGGEMPTQALISSRIFPPTSILHRDVLKRVPFDPLAGELWYEVFSRECALANEKIVVAPIFSSALDEIYASKRETTKKITGGILDKIGLSHGIKGRLLSLEQPASLPDQLEAPHVIAGDSFSAAQRINPFGKVRDWEPVNYNPEIGGLLVHPLDDEIVAAELTGPNRKVARLVANVRNINLDNTGADTALALVSASLSTQEFLDSLERSVPGERQGYLMTEWVYVAPGESVSLSLASYSVSNGRDRIILLSKVTSNGDETNCHIIFDRIEASYNENLI